MHKAQSILAKEIKHAGTEVKVGGYYYHYKKPNNTYKVLNIATMEADDEVCVVYQAQYDDKPVFVRPLKSWLDKIKLENQIVARFTFIK